MDACIFTQLLWGVCGEFMEDPLVGDLQVLLGNIYICDAVGAFILFGIKKKHWRFIQWDLVVAFWPTYVHYIYFRNHF